MIVSISASRTFSDAYALGIGISDDCGGDIGSITVSIEQIIARPTLFACTKRCTNQALAIAQSADVDGYIIEILLGWTVKYTGIIWRKSSIRNWTLSNA